MPVLQEPQYSKATRIRITSIASIKRNRITSAGAVLEFEFLPEYKALMVFLAF